MVTIYKKTSDFIKKEDKVKEKPWDKNYKPFYDLGMMILKTLAHYEYVNMPNIVRAVNVKKPSEWKKEHTPKVVSMLRAADLVECHEMKREKEASLIVYSLTDKGHRHLGNQKEAKIINTDEVIKNLPIIQYHINTLATLGTQVTKAYYNCFNIGGSICPSLIRYKNAEGKNISLFAFNSPKTEKEVSEFGLRLILLQQFLIDNSWYNPAIPIILCESTVKANWIAWQLDKYKQTRILFNVYTLDMTTHLEDPLSFLYTFEAKDEGFVMSHTEISIY